MLLLWYFIEYNSRSSYLWGRCSHFMMKTVKVIVQIVDILVWNFVVDCSRTMRKMALVSTLLKMLMSHPPVTSRECWDFNDYALPGLKWAFPDQEQTITGNPEKNPVVFPARKSLINDITGTLTRVTGISHWHFSQCKLIIGSKLLMLCTGMKFMQRRCFIWRHNILIWSLFCGCFVLGPLLLFKKNISKEEIYVDVVI